MATRATALVRTLKKSGSRIEQRRAAAALAGFTAFQLENRSAAVAAGAIPVLVPLLQEEHDDVAEQAARALGNIVMESAAHQASVIAAGAAPLLVQLLE